MVPHDLRRIVHIQRRFNGPRRSRAHHAAGLPLPRPATTCGVEYQVARASAQENAPLDDFYVRLHHIQWTTCAADFIPPVRHLGEPKIQGVPV